MKTQTVRLTRKQIMALLLNTDGGDVVIQQTHSQYFHTYVEDAEMHSEHRLLHVGKKGEATVCAGPISPTSLTREMKARVLL